MATKCGTCVGKDVICVELLCFGRVLNWAIIGITKHMITICGDPYEAGVLRFVWDEFVVAVKRCPD